MQGEGEAGGQKQQPVPGLHLQNDTVTRHR